MPEYSIEQKLYLKKRKLHKRIVIIARILILVVFLFLWQYTASIGLIDSFIFSTPIKIKDTFFDLLKNGTLIRHIGITLYETLVSFFFVNVLSIVFAMLLWLYPKASEILDPYMVVLNSLPKSALAPLLIVWLGANQTTIIVCGISVAIFGSIIGLYSTFSTIDPEKIKLIYTLHGTKLQAMTKVILPGSVPAILSTMKVNIGLCLVGVVIGEFLAARAGLGYMIIYASQIFKMNWLLLGIMLLCVMAILLYAVINLLETIYKK